MPRRRKPEESPQDQQRRELASAYARCFSTAEGAIVLEDLKRRYQDQTSIAYHAEHGEVLVNRVLVAEGQRLVFLHITQMMEEVERDARSDAAIEADAIARFFPDGES